MKSSDMTGLWLLLFVGLKLAGIITWSWIWVLTPLWVPLVIGLGFAAYLLWAE